MAKKLLVFGASGHAKDVIACAEELGYESFQLVTSNGTCSIEGREAIKEENFDASDFEDWDCIVAIGNNDHRARFFVEYPDLNYVNIISKQACIRETASIGKGVYIGAFAYVGPDSRIEDGVILNTACVLGHDSKVGDYSHVCPKVCISGHVEIGKKVFIGAGSLFNNGNVDEALLVVDYVNIGMGCNITQSILKEGAKLIPKPNYLSLL